MGCRMQDAGCRMQDTGYRMQEKNKQVLLVKLFFKPLQGLAK